MGITREPGLQRRRRLGPGGPAESCSSLPCGPGPRDPPSEAAARTPPAASRTRSDPGSPADSGPPAGPRPAADPGPSSVKPRPFKRDSQPLPSHPLPAVSDGQQPSANEHALRWRAGLRVGGQRSGSQRSEYQRQFSWKKPATAASPILTAEQLLRSSSRHVPPFKKHPIPMETEYQRSFQGLAPPTEPRLRKHLEHNQRAPLFHTHMANKKRREGSEKKPRPIQDAPSPKNDKTTPPPPPQVQSGHRIPDGGGATDGDARQVEELRQKASSYRRRAWGANFDRDHLSQLLSEHNALWEPTDSATDPPTPRLTPDLCPVEALHLASRSSKTSSVTSSGNQNTQIKARTPPSPPAESRPAWREEEEEVEEEEKEKEEEEEDTDDEEGRLPTPRLKIRPVQRTHHDLTTPATGGAILVGKLKSSDDKQRGGSAVSVVDVPVKQKEAWSENSPTHHPPSSSYGSSPNHKPAASPASKPIRTKPTSPVAPPPVAPPPQHCIQGTLRKADFQHNGELGLRFSELQCPGGGCCSDEDDRLSVMSWRSAASCSVASAVLERAQKRREHFWGKR